MSGPLTAWLLTDGAPGHESQSRGLVDAIGRFRPLDVVVVPLRVRRRLAKSAGRTLLRLRNPQWLMSLAYDLEPPPDRPALIVSSGGNTLLANALLARRHGVPNLYSGTPKGYDPAWYSRVFTVTPQGGGTHNVVLPLPPVPGALCAPMPAPSPDAPLLLLAGGDGGGFAWREDDWQALAQGMAAAHARTGRRWLVATSRRTGAVAESVLARALPADAVDDAVYWSREPRKVVRDFLARAAAACVTADSLTMVAEAIYAGRPVHVVSPASGAHDAQDAAALAGYARAGFIRQTGAASLPDADLLFVPPPVPDIQALVWASVRELLP